MRASTITPRILASMRAAYAKARPRPTTPEQQHVAAINAIDAHNPGDRHRLAGYRHRDRLAEVIREVIS